MSKKLSSDQRRTFRTRNKLRRININRAGLKDARPRLSVHRSNKQIYAQVIDDVQGLTLAAASSLDAGLGLTKGSDIEAAQKVGQLIAERAKQAGVSAVMFDRGRFLYHGRIKALAEGAREGGLEF